MSLIPRGSDDRRFTDTNDLFFRPTWSGEQVDWWREHVLGPYDMYPDDLARSLSEGVGQQRSFAFTDLDVRNDSFVATVEGYFGDDGEIRFTRRKLDLKGHQLIEVPDGDQHRGSGRLLMADLVRTACKLDIPTIEIEAQCVGRYAWARLGFVPERTAWMNVRLEAKRRLAMALPEVGEARFSYCSRVLDGENPALIREVASWPDLVTTRFTRFGREPDKTTLGRALLLETPAHWHGKFDRLDKATMAVFEAYVGGRDMRYDFVRMRREEREYLDALPPPDATFLAAAREAVLEAGIKPWEEWQRDAAASPANVEEGPAPQAR